MGLICKIFKFLLDIFKGIVNVIAEALSAIAVAVVDVLSEVASAVSDGLLSSPVGLVFAGIVGFALFKWLMPPPEADEAKKGVINA